MMALGSAVPCLWSLWTLSNWPFWPRKVLPIDGHLVMYCIGRWRVILLIYAFVVAPFSFAFSPSWFKCSASGHSSISFAQVVPPFQSGLAPTQGYQHSCPTLCYEEGIHTFSYPRGFVVIYDLERMPGFKSFARLTESSGKWPSLIVEYCASPKLRFHLGFSIIVGFWVQQFNSFTGKLLARPFMQYLGLFSRLHELYL